VAVVAVEIGTEAVTVSSYDTVSLTIDLLAPGSPFTLTLARIARADLWDRVRSAAKLYAPVTVSIDGAVQVRGVIRRRRGGADRNGQVLTISGTDYAGLAQVAEVPFGFELKSTTLGAAIERLYQPLGIPVTIGVSAEDARSTLARTRPGAHGGRRSARNHAVDAVKATPGETIQQLADALCRRYGYLLHTAPFGSGVGLVIDRPAYDSPVLYRLARLRRPGEPERYSGNIIDGARDLDGTTVPTSVTVQGHTGASAASDAHVRGYVENARLRDHPLVALGSYSVDRYVRDKRARSPQVALHRGEREIARRMGDFETYTATTPGFAFGERLWTVNAMCRLDDDLEDVHGDWLITRVDFSQARPTGQRTALRLIPKNGLVLEPDTDT